VPTPIRLPAAAGNPVSLAGMVVATTMAILFIVLLVLEAIGAIANPYFGLLLFVTIPILFVAALLLIPLGAWWSARRRGPPEGGPHTGAPHSAAISNWPVIDLGNPRHRTTVAIVLMLTLVNVVIVSMAAYGGVHYLDSSEFCGQVCHTTMEPEYVAYQAWPHARVECAQCHVGPGVGAVVQAKLAGTRQLYHVLTNQVPKPVPPPPHLIRPARDTCEQCHWPEKFHGDTVRVIREFGNDEQSTESITRLTLHVGGGSVAAGTGTGIHWHMNLDNVVEFVETEPGTVPYVRVTDRQGHVREFVAKDASAAQFAAAPKQRMDCMDCHNRPAHTMFATAERAVDVAIAEGRIPHALPYVRREVVAAVKADYPDRQTAFSEIERRLRTFYSSQAAPDAQAVGRAVEGARKVWADNVFPQMRVTWGTYRNNIGHVDTPGCFRCHDDEKKAADGTVIKQDCELCHTAPE
jgi:nitrate/TMAO reductase-like tetraheme cytochrome c subunit